MCPEQVVRTQLTGTTNEADEICAVFWPWHRLFHKLVLAGGWIALGAVSSLTPFIHLISETHRMAG